MEEYVSYSSKCVNLSPSKFPLRRSVMSNKRPKWMIMTKTKYYTYLDHSFLWLSSTAYFQQNPIAFSTLTC